MLPPFAGIRRDIDRITAIGGADAVELDETCPEPLQVFAVQLVILVIASIRQSDVVGRIGDNQRDTMRGDFRQDVQAVTMHDLVEERF